MIAALQTMSFLFALAGLGKTMKAALAIIALVALGLAYPEYMPYAALILCVVMLWFFGFSIGQVSKGIGLLKKRQFGAAFSFFVKNFTSWMLACFIWILIMFFLTRFAHPLGDYILFTVRGTFYGLIPLSV